MKTMATIFAWINLTYFILFFYLIFITAGMIAFLGSTLVMLIIIFLPVVLGVIFSSLYLRRAELSTRQKIPFYFPMINLGILALIIGYIFY